jgi:TRAP-type C4-dicarboxylate transport system permease small subunit
MGTEDKQEQKEKPKDAAASWGAPLVRIDAAWQKIEARLCAGVVVAEIASLTLWVSLRGLSTDYAPGGNKAGLLFRCILTAAALGVAAHLATRKRDERTHRIAVTAAAVVGLFVARLWVHVGVAWSSNFLNWLQNASVLMLIGGLRGLVTRLTLWLALLGASLATSRGKHIHVDVLIRQVPPKMRAPAAMVGWVAAAAVCIAGVFGFVDSIAINKFRALADKPCPAGVTGICETTAGEKWATVSKEMGSDLFLLGRQASLDWKTLPHALGGTPYDHWMTADDWNAWLDDADWTAHFDKAAVDGLRADPAQPAGSRMPQVSAPGTGEQVLGLLVRELDLVFPFGLAVIALKFLLRVLLVLAGRIKVDPDAMHEEEDLAHAQDRDDAAAQEAKT